MYASVSTIKKVFSDNGLPLELKNSFFDTKQYTTTTNTNNKLSIIIGDYVKIILIKNNNDKGIEIINLFNNVGIIDKLNNTLNHLHSLLKNVNELNAFNFSIIGFNINLYGKHQNSLIYFDASIMGFDNHIDYDSLNHVLKTTYKNKNIIINGVFSAPLLLELLSQYNKAKSDFENEKSDFINKIKSLDNNNLLEFLSNNKNLIDYYNS